MWPRLEPFETLVEDGEALATAVLPAMKPASAAPIMSDFIDFVIAAILLYLVLTVLKFSFDGGPVQITCEAFCRISPAYGIPFFGMPAARAV